MSRKFILSSLAAMMTIAITVSPSTAATKKKVIKPKEPAEKSEAQEAFEGVMLDVAAGVLAGGLKKAKMPKGGKLILKSGLKAMKESAKKDSGKKKDPLKALFGADDE